MNKLVKKLSKTFLFLFMLVLGFLALPTEAKASLNTDYVEVVVTYTPTNDSLTFTNPDSGNIAIANDATEWNFQAVVSHEGGYTDLDTVVLRLANSSDNTTPYDALKFTWTEATDTFAETTDTQNAATITSTGSDSNCADNTCTLDFKIKFNSSFATQSTNYNAELFTTDDTAATDENSYTDFYQVGPVPTPIPALKFEGVKMEGVKIN